MNKLIEKVKQNIEEFKSEEYTIPAVIESWQCIADKGEQFLGKLIEEDIDEDEIPQLMGVFQFVMRKYIDVLQESEDIKDFDKFDESMTKDEIMEEYRESMENLKAVLESTRLSGSLFRLAVVYDFEKMKNRAHRVDEKLQKLSDEKQEDMIENLEKELDENPFIFEIGATLSSVRLFVKLMGEQPELEKYLPK